ncbi:hypothetical protein FPCIR_2578 [Fusarium pseudocircinatum]|uniref:Uncharacterized protein n=1 Tax=Fusarium pseudocircinatum TaxID=56676 RepID=A0A8H5PMI2_9HYPO|nr:hypothetical protein FPCIR_2578 [Fusarium pseudocircinatum]
MHIARQTDLRIRHGVNPNDTGRTVFRPLRPRQEKLLRCNQGCWNGPTQDPFEKAISRGIWAVTMAALPSAECRVQYHPGQLLPQRRNIGMTTSDGHVRLRISSSNTHTYKLSLRYSVDSNINTPSRSSHFKVNMPRSGRAQAHNLEQWWKKDTMEAARHNINGKKLAEKEGDPSTVDDLFEKTCREREAEMAKSGETADSESPNYIFAFRIIQLIHTYTHCYHAHYISKSISKSSNKNMASITRASLKRTRSTASLNDAVKVLSNDTFPFRQNAFDPHHAKPDHVTNTQFPTRTESRITQLFPVKPIKQSPSKMAPKKATLKASKAGKSKSARNVSSETKVCPQPLAQTATDLTQILHILFSFIRYRL